MGSKFFQKLSREYLAQLPGEEERRMMGRLYRQLDQAIAQWKETFKEVERVGKAFWEVREFQRFPELVRSQHMFLARSLKRRTLPNQAQLWKYSPLGHHGSLQ